MYLRMYAEVFKDNKWQKVGSYFKSALNEMGNLKTDRPCDEKNFVLYEILTGIHMRQNDNLTKIKSMNSINSLPDDTSMKFKKLENETYYYTTLKNIINYDWDAQISNIGTISERQYKKLKQNGIWPANMNRHVLYPNYKIVSPFEMDMILSGTSDRDSEAYYIRFEYNTRPIKNECKFFCNISIPELIKLVPYGNSYDSVRIVYAVREP